MLKSLKYELKSTYKFFLMILIGMSISDISLFYILNVSDTNNSDIFKLLITTAFMMVFISSILVFAFMIISSFRREFYTDKGYFTFSIPLNSNEFLGSKLVATFIWLIIFIFSLLTINILFIYFKTDSNILTEIFYNIKVNSLFKEFILLIYTMFFVFLEILLMYFSIILGKILFRNNKLGYIWFVVFIILNFFISFLDAFFKRFIPFYFTIMNNHIIYKPFNNFIEDNLIFNNLINLPFINLGMMILVPFLCVSIFYLTSYLIHKKVEI